MGNGDLGPAARRKRAQAANEGMRQVLVVLATLAVAVPAAADPAASKDIPVGWKIAIGCTAATIALSGVVGAVSHEPIDNAVRKLSPQLADVLGPPNVAAATAAIGFAAGITIAVVASVTAPE